jgi:O-antigen ligase
MFWIAPNGHNGAVDMLLDIGWLGMLSFAGSLLMGFWRAITWMRLCHNPEGLWPICYLTFLLFYNVTESSLIIEPANIFWFLYVVVTTTILIQPLPITSRQRPRSQTLQSAQHHPVV